ncbi:MAG: hypothetical protein ACKO2P_05865, partial [Planctomycetota bacterium]
MPKVPEVLTNTLICWSLVATACFSTVCLTTAGAQETEFRPLWPETAPGAAGTTDADRPGL